MNMIATPSELNKNVQFVNSSFSSGSIFLRLGFSEFFTFLICPFLMCSSRISFAPGNSRGKPRITMEKIKIKIPKITKPNHQAPIHRGSRGVRLRPSGCKITTQNRYFPVQQSVVLNTIQYCSHTITFCFAHNAPLFSIQ